MDNKRFVSELLWVLKVHYSKGSSVESHVHQFHYQFMYVVDGKCSYVSHGVRHTLHAGSCSLLLPGNTHAIEWVSEDLTTYELKFILDDADFAECLNRVPAVFEADSLIRALMPAIIDAAGNPASEANRLAFSYHLGSLLYHIARPYQTDEPLKENSNLTAFHLGNYDVKSNENFSDATKSAMLYINEHFREDVSLDNICNFIKYNKSYLCSAFKKDTGKTLNEYLTNIRVKSAACLITSGKYTLAEICTMTGFKTLSHFDRIFKKTTGITPSLYKNAFPKDSIIADLASLNLSDETRSTLSRKILIELSR